MKPIILNLLFFLFSMPLLLAQDLVLFDEIRLTETIRDYGLTGKGTIVAVLDRGIDYRHPDFINPDGTSRILYIVDLLNNSGANDPGNPLGRGTIFTNAEINQALQQNTPLDTRDAVGHGHITTSIAAGNGRGSNGAILGIAPEASIIAVKITGEGAPAHGDQVAEAPFNFIDSHLMPAIDFINAKATEEGMPVVMIANFGSIQGPMDGTSEQARMLDQRFGEDAPGRAFISGSSDDGGVNNHAGGVLVQGQTISLDLAKVVNNLRLDLWHHEDDILEIEIVSPTQTYTAITSPANNTSTTLENSEFRLFYQGSDVDFFGSTSPRKEILIDFSGPNGVYKLNIKAVTINNGRFDAVLNPSRILPGGGSRFITFLEPGGTVWDLATAKNNICPNSYILRKEWTTVGGTRTYIGDENGVGSLWTGSGVGPTQDGRYGIDISVPGNTNFGALAEDSYFASFQNSLLPNGPATYGTLAAVSGASPVLTGAVALMLEADPSLTAPQIKKILQETARADAFTGMVPNNEWGYGKLDVYAAIQQILGPSVSIEKEQDINQAVQVMPNPSANTFTVSRNTLNNHRFQLQVVDVNGKLIQQTVWAAGEDQKTIDMSSFAPGIYYLNGKANTGFFVKKLIKL